MKTVGPGLAPVLACLIWLVAAAAAAESYRYDQPVELEGVLVARTSDPAVTICDKAHQYLALQLREPLETVCSPGVTDCQPETGITQLHLLVKDKLQSQLKKLQGKKIRLNGTLIHADDSHHFTAVLMEVKALLR